MLTCKTNTSEEITTNVNLIGNEINEAAIEMNEPPKPTANWKEFLETQDFYLEAAGH